MKIVSTLLVFFALSVYAQTDSTQVPPPAPSTPASFPWQQQMDSLATITQNATVLQTLAQAKVRCERMQHLAQTDSASPERPIENNACTLLMAIAHTQATTAQIRNQTDSLWKVRLSVQKDIVAIQNHIIQIESGKASSLAADLEAEKKRLAQSSAASAEEKERLRLEALEREKRLQAEAADREKLLKSELAEKERLLAEERRKAEERQNDARKKLDALQSKLINVHKDARGIILSMSDILFDVNKASLTPDLKTSLAKIAGILTVYSESNVIVEGHTDNTGSEEHNQKLSEQRAGNVKQFLVEQGVNAKRLRSEGFGFSKPIGDNSTPEGRQKNRRVDLVIQDKNLQ